MSKKQIVLGGRAYADIDVLACIEAYVQLLTLQGFWAQGIITGPWNQTITSSIRKWPVTAFKTFSHSKDDCQFVLVDVSDPRFLDEFVAIDRVVEVYDHHYGDESFWKMRLPKASFIEPVGACATLIWEKFKEKGFEKAISSVNANLLYSAIFANTLNFTSRVTTERDITASKELLNHTALPSNWRELYYAEVAEEFNKDLSAHVRQDTKLVDVEGDQIFFGQIEIWDGFPIIEGFDRKFTPKPNEEWLINIASIKENRSYFYTNSDRLREKIRKVTLAEEMNRYFQVSGRIWLRKEILKGFLAL